jgi:hypothetical protein
MIATFGGLEFSDWGRLWFLKPVLCIVLFAVAFALLDVAYPILLSGFCIPVVRRNLTFIPKVSDVL